MPGVLTLFGLILLYAPVQIFFDERVFSLGDLGVFLILAYVAGHVIQTAGNLLEGLFWKIRGGWPTDWVRSGQHKLLTSEQTRQLEANVNAELAPDNQIQVNQLDSKDWFSLTRQIYAKVNEAGRSERVDIFNGNYGLFRGIASSATILFVLGLINWVNWQFLLALLLMAAAALYRMHRFGRYYAREMFVEFINTKTESGNGDGPQQPTGSTQ